MLQRSPTYLASRPAKDKFINFLRRLLPEKIAYSIGRLKFICLQWLAFNTARWWPGLFKRYLLWKLGRELGAGYDIATHFTPRYRPWEQRLCIVPDSDFFLAVKSGKASIVTDIISGFTEKGIALESGNELEADLIVTATGLDLQMLGGLEIIVDGKATDISSSVHYKGLMFSGIPNLASCFGYTNASWTLKADLASEYLCRLLRHMDATGMRQCMPATADPTMQLEPFVDFSSGYFERAAALLPRQGSQRPWKLQQNYLLDVATLRYSRIDDGVLAFS
jgi:cation diffusion facilitator CzcD-associated flavoprotein CzcO